LSQSRGKRNGLVRAKGVALRLVDGEAFLLCSAENSIHHLNPTALAVWRLLAQPQRRRAVIDILGAAFPGVPLEQIRSDLDKMLDEMEADGLVLRAAAPG
jgi:Coenzyme PQQ synthesis protein D (PqqD)